MKKRQMKESRKEEKERLEEAPGSPPGNPEGDPPVESNVFHLLVGGSGRRPSISDIYSLPLDVSVRDL